MIPFPDGRIGPCRSRSPALAALLLRRSHEPQITTPHAVRAHRFGPVCRIPGRPHVVHFLECKRVSYAFDPGRRSIPPIGGDRTGNDRSYEEYAPVGDALYDDHPEEPGKGGCWNGWTPFVARADQGFTPARRRIDEMKRELPGEMPLHELRRARALTQQDLAEMLQVNQPAVSKLEQRADVYISSLRSYIGAVGGKLKIVAEFPEGEVAITNFSDVGEVENRPPQAG